jgi:hypothetical protein
MKSSASFFTFIKYFLLVIAIPSLAFANDLKLVATKLNGSEMNIEYPYNVHFDENTCDLSHNSESGVPFTKLFVLNAIHRGLNKIIQINPQLVIDIIKISKLRKFTIYCKLVRDEKTDDPFFANRVGMAWRENVSTWYEKNRYDYFFEMNGLHGSIDAQYNYINNDISDDPISAYNGDRIILFPSNTYSNFYPVLRLYDNIFHEFLHVVNIDNYTPKNHNNNPNSPSDVVYACSGFAHASYDDVAIRNLSYFSKTCNTCAAAKVNFKDNKTPYDIATLDLKECREYVSNIQTIQSKIRKLSQSGNSFYYSKEHQNICKELW